MRIPCPHCGERGNEEFVYLGDATVARPDGNPSVPLTEVEQKAWVAYVYLRDNPRGAHRELWQHVAGCRCWLVVTRDATTHQIASVEPARDVALSRAKRAAT